jgi:hypothetical protein
VFDCIHDALRKWQKQGNCSGLAGQDYSSFAQSELCSDEKKFMTIHIYALVAGVSSRASANGVRTTSTPCFHSRRLNEGGRVFLCIVSKQGVKALPDLFAVSSVPTGILSLDRLPVAGQKAL